jgi:protein involved in polysaccharide export with SLBB domain
VWRIENLAAVLFLSFVLGPSMTSSQEHRKIRPGDALQIIVHNNETLSQTVVASPEGTVDFPFMQDLPVEGMMLGRFQEILRAQLARYMEKSPLITVRFTETYPVKITVLGQIARPGIYSVPNTSTVQGAIGQAGGFVPGARLSKIRLIRAGETNGYRNGTGAEIDSVNIVNMEKFYLEGDPGALPALKDGDVIVVPGNPMTNSVKMLGNVMRPGSYDVAFPTNLLDVLFMAGGPAANANLHAIRVLSPGGEEAREVRIDMQELLDSRNLAGLPRVAPGDVVYVPERKVTWGKFMSVARDLTIFASLYLVINYGR